MQMTTNLPTKLKLFVARKGIKYFEKACYRTLHLFPPLPWIVIVELTNKCNAKCTMCDRATMTRESGHMDWDLYTYIIDQLAGYKIRRVNLNRFGEPLLHPRVVDMVRYAKEKGIKEVAFVTNGTLLDEKMSSDLIDAGLDKINVSVDGATAETFEKIRLGCKFDKVTANLEGLIEMRKRKKASHPFVQINTLLMQDTLHELPMIVNKWRPLVDQVRLGPALQYGNINLTSMMPREGLKRKPLACSELFWKIIIFRNGDVTVCCEDIDGKMKVGNIRENTLKELWTNEKIKRIRKLHFKKDFSALPVCESCDLSNENMVTFMDNQTHHYARKLGLYMNAM